MVQRALHPNCQRGIERMGRDPDYEDDLFEDKLERDEWDYLKKVCDFLADFSEVTLASEGRGASLELVLPQMDFLLTQTEKARDMYEGDPMMRVGVMAAWKKFDKYYALTGRSAAYCAATLFNPAQKKGWINSKWTPKEVEDGMQKVDALWKSRYKPEDSVPALAASSRPTQSVTTQYPKKKLTNYEKYRKANFEELMIRETITDELEQYLQDALEWPGEEPNDLIKWWTANSATRYKHLSKMAIDVLSIPAMAAEPERLFSGAAHTLTKRRNRMKAGTLEMVECLKSWLGGHSTAFMEDNWRKSAAQVNEETPPEEILAKRAGIVESDVADEEDVMVMAEGEKMLI
jgi:hAT family protein